MQASKTKAAEADDDEAVEIAKPKRVAKPKKTAEKVVLDDEDDEDMASEHDDEDDDFEGRIVASRHTALTQDLNDAY